MPIKYQCLGGGKELLNVTINTGVKSTVTLKGETKQTDESANVTFSRVPIGVHTATIKTNKVTFTKKIKVVSQLDKCGLQVKDLPIGSKIKFSSGKKFVLMAKDHPIHDAGSATFLSEFIIERALWGGNSWCYKQSNIHKTILPSYYEELNQPEKNAIINYEFTAFDDNAYVGKPQCPDTVGDDARLNDFVSDKYPGARANPVDIMRSHFYLPNNHEYGGTVADGDYGENLGFSSDKDRIKKFENGNVGDYFTRTSGSPYRGQTYIDYEYITETGYFKSTNGPDSVNVYRGIVPACDITQDAFVTLGDDGYYRIIADRFLGKLAKDLPLKSKIKLSSGKTFILRAKNASGHEDNTVTLMSEYIIENAKWSNGIEKVPYSSSDVRTKTLRGYYNELTTNEKLSFVPYGEHGDIWLMAESDASSLNLSVQGDRIMKFSNGKTGDWMTRDYRDSVGEQTQDGAPQDGVTKYKRDSFQNITKVWTGGKFADDEVPEYTGIEISYSNDPTWRTESGAYQECGVVPFFDLDGDTKLEKSSDGYYRILGM